MASDRGRVLVVGAINVDLVIAAPRLPRAGETVVGAGVERHGGGKGANAAVAAARAGAAVTFVGAVGTDAAAEEAERDLRQAGVDCDGVERLDGHPTGVALIVVDRSGENQIAVGAGANHALRASHVDECIRRAATEGLDCVLVSTEVSDDVVATAVRAAVDTGTRCVLNPAPPTDAVLESLSLAPILTPNRGELRALLTALSERSSSPRGAELEDDPQAQAEALAEITRAAVCVTLGHDGVLVCDGDDRHRLPVAEVGVRDTTGAGDTFNGVLAAWLAGGAPVIEAALAATSAATLSVTAVGARAGMPSRAAIERSLAESRPGA